MKLLKSFSSHIVQIVILAITVVTPSIAGEFSKGILWEVSGKGTATNYLLGTIHSDDPRVTTLPAPVQTAMYKARSFTAEMDLNLAAMLEAQMQMMLPPEQELKEIIGTQRYNKAVNLMNNYGMPEMFVARMKPWAIAAQLMMPRPTNGIFLDLKLFQEAQARGIKTYGLETAAEQMAAFESMTSEQQIALLDQSLRDHKDMPAMIQELIKLYLARDLAGLHQYSEVQMQKSDLQLAQALEKNLITDRNRRMVERMQVRFQEGNALIAVGALHLPSEQGILQLLKARGYQLRALY